MTRQSLEHEIACIQAAFSADSPISPEERAEVIRNALVRTYLRAFQQMQPVTDHSKEICERLGADPRFAIP